MRVLIVLAHPEPQSLNAALRHVAVEELESQGHEVQVSDLYAMDWKSHIDRADFPALAEDTTTPLRVAVASYLGYNSGQLTEDVVAEQQKLLWADTVIFQYPLWWLTMPAILTGWIERVLSCGFAYGVGEYNEKRWGNRYGEGPFVGKRAMLLITAGGWPEHFSARGITGPIDDILFPVNHGILFYTGFDVLPPFVVYRADRIDQSSFKTTADHLRERIRMLAVTEPIPYRRQNFGDYEIPTLTLREDVQPGATGYGIHTKVPPELSNGVVAVGAQPKMCSQSTE